MQSQKHLFSLPDSVTYINAAYMAPQLKSVEQVGLQSVLKKGNPTQIKPTDFFTDRQLLKQRFAQLVDAPDWQNCAIIPSVSYGIATVAKNIHLDKDDTVLLIDEQFPSNVYVWKERAKINGAHVELVAPPPTFENRAQLWNEDILNKISPQTKVVAMGQVHWADGTLFDLKAIRKQCDVVGAKLIIDGTQSVGALPFSVQEIQPDALICAGYKWLMGPYSIGMAYYADTLLDGEPLEYNWINRKNSEDFSQLVNYQEAYQPKADKYCVGESSNFILVPMFIAAIEQLLDWGVPNIQNYCNHITTRAITQLQDKGCFIEEDTHRGHHLFGIYLPEHMDIEALKNRFREKGISVGFRGNAIRVAPHLYNTEADFEKLVSCF